MGSGTKVLAAGAGCPGAAGPLADRRNSMPTRGVTVRPPWGRPVARWLPPRDPDRRVGCDQDLGAVGRPYARLGPDVGRGLEVARGHDTPSTDASQPAAPRPGDAHRFLYADPFVRRALVRHPAGRSAPPGDGAGAVNTMSA